MTTRDEQPDPTAYMPTPAIDTPVGAVAASTADAPLGVVDIGSNSGRIVVLRRTPLGHLEVVEDVGAPLRLVQSVDADGRLNDAAIEHLFEVLHDFRQVATRAGATPVVALATAAMREAANGREVAARIERELGFEVQVITSDQEAEYGFRGAVAGLDADHGHLLDIGGGSAQVVRFRQRDLRQAWSMPLGALRLSGKFLDSYPPSRGDRRRLVEHVQRTIIAAGIPKLGADEQLIGTGGTIRNLAKVDRKANPYPIDRLHGYVLTRGRLDAVTDQLLAARPAELRAVRGLNNDRVDSIVGGALMLQTLMELVGARHVLVSGQGMRDGVAMERLASGFPPPAVARQASIAAVCARFSTWDAVAAGRRAALAAGLYAQLVVAARTEVQEALAFAATALDIGRSVDHYARHSHAAEIMMAADLVGYSHHDIAFLAAIIYRAGNLNGSLKRFQPLVTAADEAVVGQAGAVLALADELERRLPLGASTHVRCEVLPAGVVVHAPVAAGGHLAGELQKLEPLLGVITLTS